MVLKFIIKVYFVTNEVKNGLFATKLAFLNIICLFLNYIWQIQLVWDWKSWLFWLVLSRICKLDSPILSNLAKNTLEFEFGNQIQNLKLEILKFEWIRPSLNPRLAICDYAAVNFINVPKWRLYEKRARLTLMKLTPVLIQHIFDTQLPRIATETCF